jgi:hypothetical protein
MRIRLLRIGVQVGVVRHLRPRERAKHRRGRCKKQPDDRACQPAGTGECDELRGNGDTRPNACIEDRCAVMMPDDLKEPDRYGNERDGAHRSGKESDGDDQCDVGMERQRSEASNRSDRRQLAKAHRVPLIDTAHGQCTEQITGIVRGGGEGAA